MQYDAQGYPDPNGDYQDTYEGPHRSRTMEDGEYFSFNPFMADARAAQSRVFITDSNKRASAQRTFADSAEGRAVIAQAHAAHDLNAWRTGRHFGDADAAAAICDAMPQRAVDGIPSKDDLMRGEAAAATAYAMSMDSHNAWRNR